MELPSGTVNYTPGPAVIRALLHLAVPVFRLRRGGAERFEIPFAAAPRLDHFRRDDIDEQLGEGPSFRVALEVIRGLVPSEVRIDHHRQKQVVAVVDDDQLSARAL